VQPVAPEELQESVEDDPLGTLVGLALSDTVGAGVGDGGGGGGDGPGPGGGGFWVGAGGGVPLLTPVLPPPQAATKTSNETAAIERIAPLQFLLILYTSSMFSVVALLINYYCSQTVLIDAKDS